MKFLYMDETYADFTQPRNTWSVCLTALLVPAAKHQEIRGRFYSAVASAVGRTPGVVPPPQEIHAARLLPESSDATRIAFLNDVVQIIHDFDLRLYRVGYRKTRTLLEMIKTDGAILGLAFMGLLDLIADELEFSSIWPVMESDHSDWQDQAFAGSVQFADHIEAHVGPQVRSRSQANLGEVLYCTKRSVHGALVDCAAYLLHVQTQASNGVALSDFKIQLRAIAETLEPAICFNEIIELRHEMPPTGYKNAAPPRYMVKLIPEDD